MENRRSVVRRGIHGIGLGILTLAVGSKNLGNVQGAAKELEKPETAKMMATGMVNHLKNIKDFGPSDVSNAEIAVASEMSVTPQFVLASCYTYVDSKPISCCRSISRTCSNCNGVSYCGAWGPWYYHNNCGSSICRQCNTPC